MAYLKNRTINLLNLHYGLHALIMYGAGAFYVVFLLKEGVSAAVALAAIALIVAGRFVIRPSILILAPRFGLRALVTFGTLFSGLQYLILAQVQGVGMMLLLLCVVSAFGDTFYWTCYHAYFAALGDAEHRGHQIGAREALSSLAGILGPLVWGAILALAGPFVAFGAAAAMHVLAALPFFGTPDVPVARVVPGVFRTATTGILLFAADGWAAAGFIFVWQIALFLSLGESFSSYGGALALAGVAGALGSLLLGRQIDYGHGSRAVWLSFSLFAAAILMRTVSTESAVLAVAANAAGALAGCLYTPTLMTAVYNQSKNSQCTLRFQLATEGGWDIGCAAGCMLTGAMLAAGAPLGFAILTSLAGAALSFLLLQRYYADIAVREAAGLIPGE